MYRSSKWNDVGIDRYMYIMRTLFDQWETYFITQCLLCTHLLPLTVLLLSLFSTIIQRTPLHISSEIGYSQVVDLLLSKPGIVVDSRDKVW